MRMSYSKYVRAVVMASVLVSTFAVAAPVEKSNRAVAREAVTRRAVGRLALGHSIAGATTGTIVASGFALLGLISLIAVAASSGGGNDANNAPVSS
jgi:hypothetical protein